MPIKSFRGKIGDGDIDTISLHTNDGSTGYRIVKLEVMSTDYGTAGGDSHTSLLKVYKVNQTTADEFLDFSDNTIIGAAVFERHTTTGTSYDSVFFDNEIFNQDIYLTHKDTQTGQSLNYYIELEQIKLDLSQNTVATLKDIRNIKSQ